MEVKVGDISKEGASFGVRNIAAREKADRKADKKV